ncbi:hypothetical protein [Streptomyces ureilyticus]|uniref:Uncharacterized protein n=1 Tax=Streptomyces ureilyticus TaxID=1775131 RepID=A0ABX0DKK4_9ACTN|nr:hypothetical protein [Streptomyces ureilyticus]
MPTARGSIGKELQLPLSIGRMVGAGVEVAGHRGAEPPQPGVQGVGQVVDDGLRRVVRAVRFTEQQRHQRPEHLQHRQPLRVHHVLADPQRDQHPT